MTHVGGQIGSDRPCSVWESLYWLDWSSRIKCSMCRLRRTDWSHWTDEAYPGMGRLGHGRFLRGVRSELCAGRLGSLAISEFERQQLTYVLRN